MGSLAEALLDPICLTGHLVPNILRSSGLLSKPRSLEDVGVYQIEMNETGLHYVARPPRLSVLDHGYFFSPTEDFRVSDLKTALQKLLANAGLSPQIGIHAPYSTSLAIRCGPYVLPPDDVTRIVIGHSRLRDNAIEAWAETKYRNDVIGIFLDDYDVPVALGVFDPAEIIYDCRSRSSKEWAISPAVRLTLTETAKARRRTDASHAKVLRMLASPNQRLVNLLAHKGERT